MIERNNMPKHIAIIMDGNGRWAKARHLPRVAGHRAGAKSVQRAVEFCVKQKVECLSLFALSLENRENRPETEVKFLLSLFLEFLRKYTAELHKHNIRVHIVGDRSRLDDLLLQHVQYTESLTQKNTGLKFYVAIDYSGRWDMLQATQKVMASGLKPEEVTEATLTGYCCFADVPAPDLLIRTSGEKRISNFMLWQLAYTELYFIEAYWPDFNETIFQEAIVEYQKRDRRFGYANASVYNMSSDELC